MGHAYRAVGWNRQKRVYDGVLLGGVALFLATFFAVSSALHPTATVETILIRAFGSAAFLLLHVVLCIGPLTRLDRRFLPLLYNRRHLGVATFVLALAHGAFALIQFHTLGSRNPFVSLFTTSASYGSLADFPFQPLGALALAILFVMAATSHDFWLTNLGAPVWKALHMLVYWAWALLVMHVALGALQTERHPALLALVGAGVVGVLGLHVAAAWREAPLDVGDVAEADVPGAGDPGPGDGWVDAGPSEAIPEGRAVTVCVAGDRVAVFRHDGVVSALSNACQHQNGPLGEGRVIDGCITCPWHGYQYEPATGSSPAPFTEVVPTFDVRVEQGRVWVRTEPNPLGSRTRTAPAPRAGSGPDRGQRAEAP